ncbi:MAG: hypothetical protein ACO22R_02010 [Chitinophagaceae bacterium]|jgi:hypothetical protein
MQHVLKGIFIVLLITGCGTQHSITYSWSNKEFHSPTTYKKIFVAALVSNPHVRTHLEEEMGIAANKKGFQVERSWDHFPPTFASKNPPSKEQMIEKIHSLQCDIIFTINLVDKRSETRYIPGGMWYDGPYPGYGFYFRGFYSYWYPFLYDPGYYVTDRYYFMEGNLFDAKTETLIWSVQTTSINPSSIEDFSRSLIEVLMQKAIDDMKVVY